MGQLEDWAEIRKEGRAPAGSADWFRDRLLLSSWSFGESDGPRDKSVLLCLNPATKLSFEFCDDIPVSVQTVPGLH